MAIENTTLSNISTDIYRIAEFVESIKAKYIDIPEDTLALGVYGFLSSMFSNLIENTATMSAEYAYEAIPTKAKFERNVIAHALALGINKIFAIPAELDVTLGIPESILIDNMVDNKITLDKEAIFSIGEDQRYPYVLDYDIIIRRDKLPNGKYVYTAIYDVDNKNDMVELYNPYLPAMEVINMEGESVVILKTVLRQMTHTTVYKKVIMSNPLENKILTFDFNDQLSFFYVEVVEDGVTHYLRPIYEGLYDYTSSEEYINYMFLDENTIRLSFNRDSYQPRRNADITIHIYTTLGTKCNYSLNNYQGVHQLTSERFRYNRLYTLISNLGDSHYGTDRLSVKQLKTAIPREAISRGVVTTYTDLNNTFNAIQTEDCKMYFLEKVHNQINRLFFSYLLLKDGNNVIPTNTITAKINNSVISNLGSRSFTIKPGSAYYIDPSTGQVSGIAPLESVEDVEEYDDTSFLYICPYLTVINKTPFYVSYYLTLLDYSRYLYFEYVNKDSTLQFISMNLQIHRDFYNEPNKFKIDVRATQNISTDFQLITFDEDGELDRCDIRIFLVLYAINSDGDEIPTRYCEAQLQNFEESNTAFDFRFSFTTNDQISDIGTYMKITSGLKTIGDGIDSQYSLAPNMRAKLFYLAKLDIPPSRGRMYGTNESQDLDDLIPGLDAYTLTNVYSTGEEGLDFFYDYSDINYSYVELSQNEETKEAEFTIYKVPVVRYTYLMTKDENQYQFYEGRIKRLVNKIDQRRRYMQNILLLLENSFGIDYKFFNTYGPSKMYNIDSLTNVDRINLSLTFEIKFQMIGGETYLPLITNSIKEYIEDINYITDLHMPNLITYITNIYREQIVYIKFIKLNDYGSLHQSIYKNPLMTSDEFLNSQTVPEFININTLNTELPDIRFKIVE